MAKTSPGHLLMRSQDGLDCEANSLSLRSGVAWEYQIVFKQCFQGFPLSPALSPLVPRGEREKTKRRLLSVPLSPILRTPLSARTIAGDLPGAKSFPARCVGDGHEGLRQAGEFRPVLGLKNFAAQQRRTDSQRRAAGRQEVRRGVQIHPARRDDSQMRQRAPDRLDVRRTERSAGKI